MARPRLALAILVILVLLYFAGNYLLTPTIRSMRAEGLIPGSESEWRVLGSLLKTIPTAVGLALMVLWAVLADKIGRRGLILGLALAMAGSLVLVSTARNYDQLLAYFTIFGVGLVGISPIVYAFVADIMPSHRRGAGYAAYYAASVVGMIVGLAIGAALSWRLAYLATGVAIALAALPLYAASRGIEIGHAERVEVGKFSFRKVVESLKCRTLAIMLAQQILWTIPWGMLALWSVDYIMTRWGLPKVLASLVLIVATASIAVGHVVGGLLSDRLVRKGDVLGRVKISVLGICVGYAAMVAMLAYPYPYGSTSASSLLPPMLLAAAGMMFTTFAYPNISSVISDVVKPEVRSTVFSFYNFINSGGWALGPLIYGALVDALMSWGLDERTALLYSAVGIVSLWIGCIVAWLAVGKTYPRDRIYAQPSG